ncbi:hypothetical protein [Roseomonas indoligenes]|uniref:Uncharacterized protein n=1 Tax=Roseomonas indoligenes TaxID=2820811 RepID=A0A940S7Q6_9PROT|nr:hypothetical protein [Pararoseomonas indoligenes]MBP0493317.1 hypothetical protein [Pararoseomonas indoligenes]
MRAFHLALPFLVLAACSDDRALNDVIPVADRLREPARAAPFEYGRPGWIQGSPARAAGAASEIEAFADAAENDPLWTHPRDPVLLPRLQIARREFREALGVSPRVPSAIAARAFAGATAALNRGDEPGAVAALAPVGGAATLARLSSLPRLPRVEEAAHAVANEVNGRGRNR